MRSFKSNEHIGKKVDGPYFKVSAKKGLISDPVMTLQRKLEENMLQFSGQTNHLRELDWPFRFEAHWLDKINPSNNVRIHSLKLTDRPLTGSAISMLRGFVKKSTAASAVTVWICAWAANLSGVCQYSDESSIVFHDKGGFQTDYCTSSYNRARVKANHLRLHVRKPNSAFRWPHGFAIKAHDFAKGPVKHSPNCGDLARTKLP